MKPGTKEFYDVMAQFEKDALELTYGKKLEREAKDLWSRGCFYCNGEINIMFKAYLMGYSYARVEFNLTGEVK